MKVLVIVAGLVIAPFKRKAAEGRFSLASLTNFVYVTIDLIMILNMD